MDSNSHLNQAHPGEVPYNNLSDVPTVLENDSSGVPPNQSEAANPANHQTDTAVLATNTNIPYPKLNVQTSCFSCMTSMPQKPSISIIPPNHHFQSVYEDLKKPFPPTLTHTELKWTYMAAIGCKTSAVGQSLSNEEESILNHFATYMFVAKRSNNHLGRAMKTKSRPYQRIALFNCSGGNTRAKVACQLQFAIYRADKLIAIYFSGVGHCSPCVPTKSHLPLGMLIQAQLSSAKSPGALIYENSDKDELKTVVKFNPTTKDGRKKIQKALNRHVTECNAKIKAQGQKRKQEGDSLAALLQWIDEASISVDEFCATDVLLALQSDGIHKQIAVLKQDVSTSTDGSYNYIIFATKGKLQAFQKAVEMGKKRGAVTLELDCSGQEGVCITVLGFSDCDHCFHSLLYGILQVENKVGAQAILEVGKSILIHEGLEENAIQIYLLKDGSPSFVAPARDLGMKQLACTAHMGRPKGVGTVGKNDRGSLESYLSKKRVPKRERVNLAVIFWAFVELPTLETYAVARELLIHYLLTQFQTGKDDVPPLAVSASIAQAQEYAKWYSPFIRAVQQINYQNLDLSNAIASEQGVPSGRQDAPFSSSNNPPQEFLKPNGEPIKKLSNLTTQQQIVVQLLAYYFPQEPTYGPVSPAGQNRDTNGLEGSWWKVQQSVSRNLEHISGSILESIKSAVRGDTYDLSDINTEPTAVKREWDSIIRYSKPRSIMPGQYFFSRFYKTDTGEHLPTKAEVRPNLDNITVYIPTKQHLFQALIEGKTRKHARLNPFGCSEYIQDVSNVKEAFFKDAMKYKKEIHDVINQNLYSKFKTMQVCPQQHGNEKH